VIYVLMGIGAITLSVASGPDAVLVDNGILIAGIALIVIGA